MNAFWASENALVRRPQIKRPFGDVCCTFLSPLFRPLATLLQDKPRVTADYFEFRRIQEAHAAQFAAMRATEVDRQAMQQCVERMKKAHRLEDPSQEGDADVDLHLLIYEASHNVVLLHVMRALADILRKKIFCGRAQLYLRERVRDQLLDQHLALAEAVVADRSKDAEAAAAEHIRFTFETVEELRRDSARLETSLSRVNRSDFLA